MIDYKGARPADARRDQPAHRPAHRRVLHPQRHRQPASRWRGAATSISRRAAARARPPERNTAEGDTITVYFSDRQDRPRRRARQARAASTAWRRRSATPRPRRARGRALRRRAHRDTWCRRTGSCSSQRAQLYLPRTRAERRSAWSSTASSRRWSRAASRSSWIAATEVEGPSHDLRPRDPTREPSTRPETAYERGLYHGERDPQGGRRRAGRDRTAPTAPARLGTRRTITSQSQLHEDLSQGQAGGEAGGVLRQERAAVRAAVLDLPDQARTPLGLPVPAVRVRVQQHAPGSSSATPATTGRRTTTWTSPSAGDYYQAEPSWVLRADGIYKLLYKLDGRVLGTYARNEARRRRPLRLQHRRTTRTLTRRTTLAGPRGGRLDAAATGASDDFGHAAVAARSTASSPRTSRSSAPPTGRPFSVVFDQRQNIDADESLKDPDGTGPLQGPAPGTRASVPNLTQQLPNVAITLPTRAIGSLSFLRNTAFSRALAAMYLSFDGRFRRRPSGAPSSPATSTSRRHAHRHDRHPFVQYDSTTTVGQMTDNRWAVPFDASLHDSRRLFGWLNFSPGVNANAVLFDVDNLGNHVVPAATWNANVSTGTSFYGTSRAQIGPIRGIRHVLFPSASFTFSPSFENSALHRDAARGASYERFADFDGIGISGARQASIARAARPAAAGEDLAQVTTSSGSTASRSSPRAPTTTPLARAKPAASLDAVHLVAADRSLPGPTPGTSTGSRTGIRSARCARCRTTCRPT